jgi:hypothetical protein
MTTPKKSMEQKTTEEPTFSLPQKLARVMEAIGWIEKTGRNEFHKYDYATEADIVDKVRKELIANRILPTFSTIATSREAKEGERGGYLTDVMIEWTFRDIDTGDIITSRVPGCGEDKGDKGLYKAITGSEKYWLTKSFLIPTGDDPERESGADGEVSRPASARGPLPTSASKSAAPALTKAGKAKLSPEQEAQAQMDAAAAEAKQPPHETESVQEGILKKVRRVTDDDGDRAFAELNGRQLWCKDSEICGMMEEYADQRVVAELKNVNKAKPNSYVVEAIGLA